MWFTEAPLGMGAISEINPTTHAFAEFPAATASIQPFGIAVGPDGNIWYTEKDVGGHQQPDRGDEPRDGHHQRLRDHHVQSAQRHSNRT